ncbi:hypothetical protein Tco_0668815 [Tanacetum coccineum]
MDSAMKHFYFNNDTCFSIDVIDEILEEDFDALLDEGSKILHSIKGTILEEKLFAEFDEFMAMTAEENFESEYDTEKPQFEKITFTPIIRSRHLLKNPKDLELKPLSDNMEYVILEEPSFLPVIISSQLSKENKNKLVSVLKNHKQVFVGEKRMFHYKYKFKQPKLRSRWLGPYVVVKHQYPSEYVKLYGKDGKTFIVNGHRLKLYHEEDNYPME